MKLNLFHGRNGLALAGLVAISAGLASCSAGRVARIDDVQPLPTDLPQEVQKKFEVQEFTAPSPSPSPSPSASPSGTPAKKVEKASEAKKSKTTAKGKKAFEFPNRRSNRPDPIWIGEKQTLEITFYGMVAGDFNLEVLPYKVVNQRKVYHIRGTAKSSSVFNLFYRVNDMVETYFDYDGLFSHRFHMLLDQTRQTRDSVELYDSEKKTVFFWNRRNHVEKGYSEVKETKDIPSFPQDSFSALYYARSLPLVVGKEYVFPVVSEGKAWEAVLKVIRKEKLETPLGKIDTIVVKAETRFQGVLKKKGDSYIWLTDDDRRFVARLEAKVKIGTVVGRLKAVEKGQPPAEETAKAD